MNIYGNSRLNRSFFCTGLKVACSEKIVQLRFHLRFRFLFFLFSVKLFKIGVHDLCSDTDCRFGTVHARRLDLAR